MEGIVTTLNRNCNMKKIFISMAVVLSVLASCNPAEDSYDNNAKTYTQEALSDCFTFTQANENGESAPDGNYFTFNTTPSTIVTVLTKNNDGSENILSKGKATGTFAIVPRRGASTSQTFYVRSMNADGTWTEVEKTANVFVPSDLTPEMKLLASDSYGSKIWKWDTEFRTDGGAWGNLGYTDGNFLSGSGDGLWWGCPPAGLTDQMKHSDTGTPIGEEDPNAYMTFSLTDGTVTSYAANGTQIRKGKFEIQNWGNGKRSIASVDGSVPNWALGNLHTDAGSILFPFKINGGGEKPTDFEIMELNGNHLKLIYAPEGTASWGEATWWAFKAKK